jgi:peptidoglycan/xylan/chitin deacetylase (PgdA/CDA1 family)
MGMAEYLITGILFVLAVLLLSAAGSFLVAFARELRRPRVICLMYHRLSTREDYLKQHGVERIFTLPVDAFDEQIAYLKESGYAFLTPAEVDRFARREHHLDGPGVLITFDDGCLSVYERALPVLRKHGAAATVFVTADPKSYVFESLTDADRRMTDDELRALDGDLVECQSHGVSHCPLTGLSDEELAQELAESKRVLEQTVSHPVTYLAVPGGWTDDRIRRQAELAGYEAVWRSDAGTVHPGDDPFALRRVNVEGHMSLAQFRSAIAPLGVAQRRWMFWIKRIPARVLGPRAWAPLRQAVLRCLPGQRLSMSAMLKVGAALAVVVVFVILVLFLWRG